MIDLSLSENKNMDLNWLSNVLNDFDLERISSYWREGELQNKLSEIHNVSKNNIFITYGAESSLDIIFTQIGFLCKKHGFILVLPEIHWAFYIRLANFYEIPVKFFELKKNKSDIAFDVDLIKKEMQKFDRAILLLNLPLNPLGINITKEKTLEIHDSLKLNQFLIIDESYFGFTNNEVDYCSFLERMEKSLIIRTFSKFFGLASMRVGYFICGDKWKNLVSFKHQYLGINSISSYMACRALDDKELFDTISEDIIREKNNLYDFFDFLEEVYPYKSDANFLLVKMDSPINYHNYLLQNGIKIRVLENKILNSHVRIGIGTEEQMKKLKELTLTFLPFMENNIYKKISCKK